MKTPYQHREAGRNAGTAASHVASHAAVRSASGVDSHLQRLANGSPQVRQLQALQRTANESVLQMKAFSPAVLNVAGEDHNESGGRRAREEYVTRWVTDGGYWTEEQFQTTANGAQVDADPRILRFLRNLHILSQLWNTLTTNRLPAQYIPAHARQVWLLTAPLIALVANDHAASVGDRYSGGATLSPGQGQTRDEINQVRYDHFHSARQALQALNNLHPYQVAQKTNVEQLLGQFKTSAVAMVQNLMERQNLDVLRSKAMHEAANAHSHTTGVWKIGQSHVDDIQRGAAQNPLLYNLMTQTEFNDEYHRLDFNEVPD